MNEKQFTDLLEIEGIYAKGFGMISKLLMQDTRVTAESKCIYSYFCSYAGNGTQAFPSVNLILYHLGMSKNRYYKHLYLLKKNGYIKTRQSKTDGKFSKTIYTIVSKPILCIQNEDTGENNSPCTYFGDTGNGDTQNGDTQNEPTNNNSIKKITVFKYNQSINNQKNLKKIDMIDNQNINFIDLKKKYPNEKIINDLEQLIFEVADSKKKQFQVTSEYKDIEEVRKIFSLLRDRHIEYVVECFNANSGKIKNIKAYLLTMLYNAPKTINSYYSNQVKSDFR